MSNENRTSVDTRRQSLKQKYKLSLNQYQEILKLQNGVCAICKRPPEDFINTFHVDHDHTCCDNIKTCGKCIRRLLCGPCNRLLGWYENNNKAIKEYINFQYPKIWPPIVSEPPKLCKNGLHLWIDENLKSYKDYRSGKQQYRCNLCWQEWRSLTKDKRNARRNELRASRR